MFIILYAIIIIIIIITYVIIYIHFINHLMDTITALLHQIIGLLYQKQLLYVVSSYLNFFEYLIIFPLVIPFLVKVTVTPEKDVYEEGDVLVFNCTHGGGPDNKYQWLINDEKEDNEDDPHLNHNITIADEDGGSYTCNVTNAAGDSSGSIFIYTKPVIIVSPKDTYLSVGAEVNFTCKARGYPTPYYIWTKTNGNLPENSSISTDEDGLSTLSIFPVMLEDYGEYSCFAVGTGSVQHSALLIGNSISNLHGNYEML